MKQKVLFVFLCLCLGISVIVGVRYRKYLYHIVFFISPVESYISYDKELDIDTDTLNSIDSGYGDWLIHPCVRYIPEGLGGHKWWMALTPYPEGNSRYEQPILYYGEGNNVTPPSSWKFFGFIQKQHKNKDGYNADPNMFYDKVSKKMIILWKEAYTENTKIEAKYNALMYRTFDGENFGEIRKLADNCSSEVEYITCPTLISIKDSLYCFATEFEYKRTDSKKLKHGRSNVALWKPTCTNVNSLWFEYSGCLMQNYRDDFDYWHTEFTYDSISDSYFSVVTDESGFHLLVGQSRDGFHYSYADKPLKSFHDNNHERNLYKASLVPMRDKFFVFYPKRLQGERRVHIYYSQFERKDFLNIFQQ